MELATTYYGGEGGKQRPRRAYFALLLVLSLTVIVFAFVAFALISFDQHGPIIPQPGGARDYSVFDESRRPAEASFSKYFTYLYNQVRPHTMQLGTT